MWEIALSLTTSSLLRIKGRAAVSDTPRIVVSLKQFIIRSFPVSNAFEMDDRAFPLICSSLLRIKGRAAVSGILAIASVLGTPRDSSSSSE